MRILHLDGGKELRGGQWQVLRLIEGLTAEGVQSTLLAREGAPLYRQAQERGWSVEPLGIKRTLQLTRQHDLLHAHDGRGHTAGAIAGSAKLVVSRRVGFPIRSRLKYRCARHYLAVSQFVKSVLQAGGVPADKISVVYDGVPLLPSSEGTAVMAPASDDPAKGTALAMEAARQAGVDLKLTKDLAGDLREAAILLYLTHSEGLGSGALLAMSAGVAVIASRVGGLTEIIRHGENGLLVENEAAQIAAALRNLRENRELVRRLGAAARQTVEERFTVGRMVHRTLEVYRQVLA